MLSIIIPVFNEEKTIAKVVESVCGLEIPNYQKQIIVVDDGSTDTTGCILQALEACYPSISVLRHDINLGKGAAIRTGLADSYGSLVLIQDADEEYNPLDWTRIINTLETRNADVVYGSRFAGDARGWHPLNWLANRFFSFTASLLYGKRLSDIQTCYKLFRRHLIDVNQLQENGFAIEVELTSKLLKSKAKYVEAPIRYRARTRKEGKKIGWRDGVEACWVLLKYRFV